MKSLVVRAHPLRCDIEDVPIPQPGPHEVLIKVIYCTSNPRDWKAPDHLILHKEIHQGNEMSGIVESICTEVYEFRAGDRVATGDPMQTANGTYYAEYAIAPVNTCFLLPPNISFAGMHYWPPSRLGGWHHLVKVLEPQGSRISVYLPRPENTSIPAGIEVGATFFGAVHGQSTPFCDQKCEEDVDFAYALLRLVSKWLAEGR